MDHNHGNPCPIVLSSASGDTMEVDASGIEKKLLGKSYVSDVETDLVSGPNLQKSGHWILLPPTQPGSKKLYKGVQSTTNARKQ